MRALVQRVREGTVAIGGHITSRIGRGYVILLGISRNDTREDAIYLAEKCANLRVLEDEHGKMNRSLNDVQGSALIVSQFTLYADAQKGNRPSFVAAGSPEHAEPLYQKFVEHMQSLLGPGRVSTGEFGAMMEVLIANDGPVTILIESPIPSTTERNA